MDWRLSRYGNLRYLGNLRRGCRGLLVEHIEYLVQAFLLLRCKNYVFAMHPHLTRTAATGTPYPDLA